MEVKKMLTDDQKKTVEQAILPILEGWEINSALEALEYAKGYISDFATLKLPPFQAGKESSDIC